MRCNDSWLKMLSAFLSYYRNAPRSRVIRKEPNYFSLADHPSRIVGRLQGSFLGSMLARGWPSPLAPNSGRMRSALRLVPGLEVLENPTATGHRAHRFLRC